MRSSSLSSSLAAASFLFDSSSASTLCFRRPVMSLKLSARISSSSLERMSSRRSKCPSAISFAPAVSADRGLVMRVASAMATMRETTMETSVRPPVAHTRCWISDLRRRYETW